MMAFKRIGLCFLACLPMIVQASFIETTIGTAVVNDATASYYNPAALVLIKNPQIIPQGTVAYFRTRFSGQSTLLSTDMTQTGSSSSNTHYYSPALYLGVPTTDRLILGLAIVTNSANRSVDENSILRYVQANNNIQDYDVVPALALKVNEIFSVGAGINFSYANFDLRPIIGFPGSNIADSQNSNESDGFGMGGNIGFLVKPSSATVVGFNYRSLTTYRLSGKSTYEGSPAVVSNNYRFKLWTPARSVFSINHFFTPKFGFIGTLQYIQWNTLTNVHVYGIASPAGILNGSIPYYLRNTWLFTAGSHYHFSPKWVLRVAASYNQSPGNPHYQIANGDSIILGLSPSYKINKTVTIDGSYAHAFIKDENINISGNLYAINGVNTGARDAVSLRLLFNV